MTGVIIAAHGNLAQAALEMCEMLTGKKEQVRTIAFCPGDSLEMLLESYEEALAALGAQPVLIVTDIKGGSPCNVAMAMQSMHANVRVLTGFSVPLLLHIFDTREETQELEELAEDAIETGKSAMRLLKLG